MIRRCIGGIGLAALLILVGAARVGAADDAVMGDWKLSMTTPDGLTLGATVKVAQEGDVLKVDYTDMEGNKPAVEEAAVVDGGLNFTIKADFQGTPLVANFKLKPADGGLKGTVAYDLAGQTGELDVAGERAQAAADPVGAWELLTVTDDGQEIPSTIKITKDGETLAGVYEIMGSETKAEELVVDKDGIVFKVTVDFQGTPLVAKFKGKIAGDELKGSVDFDLAGQTGTLDVSGKRAAAKADVAGKWDLEVVTDDGQTLKSSVKIENGADGVSGMFTTADGNEVKIEEPKLEGDELAFAIKIDFEGTPLVAKFKGKVDGADYKGQVDYDLAGQVGTLDFTGKKASE